jgi:hypothetical protein
MMGMKMTDEQLVRLRVHSNNIHRYRRLLKGNLTEHERLFVERRLAEEQSATQRLTANASSSARYPLRKARLNRTRKASDGRQRLAARV